MNERPPRKARPVPPAAGRRAAGLFLAAALVAAGCRPVELDACDVDGDCGRLHVCVEGYCQAREGVCPGGAAWCGPYGERSAITVADATLPADGRAITEVTVTVRDDEGRARAGRLVSIQTDLGGLQGPVEDHGDGRYTQRLVASTLAGAATLSFLVDGLPARETATVDFLAGPPARLLLDGLGAPHPDGGRVVRSGEILPLTLTVVDRFDNPVSVEGVIEVFATDDEALLPDVIPLIRAQQGTRGIPWVTLNAAGLHDLEVRLRPLAPGEPLPLEPPPPGTGGEDDGNGDDDGGDDGGDENGDDPPPEPEFEPLTLTVTELRVTGADADTTLVAEPRHLPSTTSPARVTVTVRDGTGTGVAGAEVAIVASDGELSEIEDAGGGVYVAELQATQSGPVHLGLEVDHLPFTANQTVCFGDCGPGVGGTWVPIGLDNVGHPTVTDFPVPVPLGDGDVDYARTAPGGADLRFYADDAVTPIPHEIERWAPGRTSLVWVSVPEIAGDSNETWIWLHYGWHENGETPESTEDPGGVWGAHYRAVWHMAEDLTETGGRVYDASGRGHDADADGGVVTAPGALSAALAFDGETGWIDAGMPGDLRITGPITLEAWVRPHPDRAAQDDAILVKANTTNTERYMLGIVSSGEVDCRFYVERQVDDGEGGTTTERQQHRVRGGNVPYGQWSHLACTYDGSTGRAFIDGAQVASLSFTGDIFDASTDEVRMGRRHDDTRYFYGAIDEVRIADRALPGSWIAAQARAMRGEMVSVGRMPPPPSDD